MTCALTTALKASYVSYIAPDICYRPCHTGIGKQNCQLLMARSTRPHIFLAESLEATGPVYQRHPAAVARSQTQRGTITRTHQPPPSCRRSHCLHSCLSPLQSTRRFSPLDVQLICTCFRRLGVPLRAYTDITAHKVRQVPTNNEKSSVLAFTSSKTVSAQAPVQAFVSEKKIVQTSSQQLTTRPQPFHTRALFASQ